MEFNRDEHIRKQANEVLKLAIELQEDNIIFDRQPNELANVSFTRRDKVVYMSQHSFYRYSGICTMTRDVGEHMSTTVPVTDRMYLFNIIKPIIYILLDAA